MSRHKQSRETKIRLPEVTLEGVVDFLRNSAQPASEREIAQALGLRHRGRRDLPQILSRLKRIGKVEEPRAGRFRLAGQSRKAEKAAESPERQAQAKESGEESLPRAGRDPNLIEGRL